MATSKKAASKTPAPGASKAPANPQTGAQSSAATQAQDTQAQRARNFLSPQKAMAIAIAGLVALLSRPAFAALLSEPEKAMIAQANGMAEELNAKTINPVKTRIAEIQAELAKIATPTEIVKPGVAEKVQKLATELTRLEKRLETFTAAAL